MSLQLAGRVVEESSVGIKWTFLKDDGTDPIIVTLVWTLADLDGNIINSREDVSVSDPTAEETIVLSGDDLALVDQDNDIEWRVMTISATYDPENGGDDLPINESAQFPIYNVEAI